MNFIDLHCHLAWDIDDGIGSKEEAQEVLMNAKADGIDAIAATPHFVPGSYGEEDVRDMNKRIQELKDLANGYGVNIYSGCEVFLNDDYLDMIESKNFNTLNNSEYLLCEFDVRKDIDKNKYAEDQLYELSIRGLTPVIAHVERYFHKGVDLERVRDWMNSGYVIQMNRTSLLGMHGAQIQKNAKQLLKEGLVHIVATDAHRVNGNRICKLSDVYQEIERETDQKTAELLCIKNPEHILRNEDVENISVTKKTWFQRIWRR